MKKDYIFYLDGEYVGTVGADNKEEAMELFLSTVKFELEVFEADME